MQKATLVIAALVLVGCSDGGTSGPPPPTNCRKADRAGTYMMSWTEQAGGTCGPIPSELISLNGGTPAGCTLHTDVWSDGECKSQRTLTCVTRVSDPTQYGGYGTVTTDTVGVTRQMSQDGARIEGTLSMSIQTSAGRSCRGTYAVSAVRQ